MTWACFFNTPSGHWKQHWVQFLSSERLQPSFLTSFCFISVDEMLTQVYSVLSSSFQNFSEFSRSQAPTVRWVNTFCNQWLRKLICYCKLFCVRKAKKCAENWSKWISPLLLINLLWLVLTGDCLPGKERLCGSSGPCGSSGWVVFGRVWSTGCELVKFSWLDTVSSSRWQMEWSSSTLNIWRTGKVGRL